MKQAGMVIPGIHGQNSPVCKDSGGCLVKIPLFVSQREAKGGQNSFLCNSALEKRLKKSRGLPKRHPGATKKRRALVLLDEQTYKQRVIDQVEL